MMYACIECGGKTKVVGHYHDDKPHIIRYRKCKVCGKRFTTKEYYDYEIKQTPEPSAWEKRRCKKIREREERKALEEQERFFCKKTNCLECPLPECYEDRRCS